MKTVWNIRSMVLLLAVVLLAACNPQERALEDLRSFAERLEANYPNYSAADWDDAVMHYSEICATLDRYKADYAPEQLEAIGRLKGRCQAIFTRHALEEGVDDFMQNIHEYKGLIEGFMEGL